MVTVSQQNDVVFVLYNAGNFVSGRTVTAVVLDETDTPIPGSPIAFTELPGDGIGSYGGTFVPTTLGDYKIIVKDNGLKVGAISVKIATGDIESIAGEVADILASVTNIEANVGGKGAYIP